MNVLLTYYSLTGQASRAVEVATTVLQKAGHQVTCCRIDFADPQVRPRRPFSLRDVKHWTDAAAKGRVYPLEVAPSQALARSYDLVLIFSNTWNHHPSTPVRSLLAMEGMKSVLNGTPFAIYVICRRSWKKNAEIVRREAEAAGGRFLAVRHFQHHGGPIGSLLTTVSYMLSSRSESIWPLPRFGLSDEAVSEVRSFTEEIVTRFDSSN